MPKQSAGILLYRKSDDQLQVFLVHPGGPFWKNKDEGSWSIPKGEYESDEEPLDAAKREFYEETGQYIDGEFLALSSIKLKSGKLIQAWAVEGDIDPHRIKSNLFEMEWPPKSGKKQSFAEVDRGDWFSVEEAKVKMNAAQVALLDELAEVKRNV
ncbi:NUDIX domain-containing protein [Mucilaginibacter dorajii]|uniref:NUDIX domain-containing protein n=1 Tax=Mucilaginibacter dorajii TaxID=692994 RepID=A0ABP7QQQ2_9SPHI|nr:NUDIX domain-containing protein [Mucilaginibacter dorajii]MCS3733952.1 putative NUDIX family NTP pyrophosphohydrolase [Mucilaginibacter dorajii]